MIWDEKENILRKKKGKLNVLDQKNIIGIIKKIKMKKQDNVITGIYKIINPKNKIYIGQSININRRFNRYKNLKESNKQYKLSYSFKKYGYINHTFEIIEECKIEDLNKRERYWQEHYNVLEEGLNLKLTETKNKSGKLSQETKTKISKSLKGRKQPNISKGKIGIKFTDQHLKNLKNPRVNNRKRILQYDKKNNFIKEWESIKSAEMHYNNNPKSDNIGACCRGSQKSSYGYIWKYKL